LRRVVLHLALAGLAGRNERNPDALQAVGDDQDSAQRIDTQRDESLLAFGTRILDGDGVRITQRLPASAKADRLPAQARAHLGGVVLMPTEPACMPNA
jgi:hypothetical protein